MTDMRDFNAQIISEFRANGGKVEQFGDAPMIILNTVGAKSGQVRETPLVALVDGDDLFVFASKAGAQSHPAWYHNLIANPEIDVEFGTDSFRASVTPLAEADRAARLDQQAALMPQFAEYKTSAAPRKIPVFSITKV